MVDRGVAVINDNHLLSPRLTLAQMSLRITFPTESHKPLLYTNVRPFKYLAV